MKKTYKAPEVMRIIYNDNIMEEEVTKVSGLIKGHVVDQTGQGTGDSWDTGGDAISGMTGDAKGTGRFWDDEY